MSLPLPFPGARRDARGRARRFAPRTRLIFLLLVGCKAPAPTAYDAPPRETPGHAASAEAGTKTPSDKAPSLEDAPCTTDADCAVTAITGAFGAAGCCFDCGRAVGTRASVERRESFCRALAPKDCPALACPAPATKAACVGGRCVAR